MDGPDSELYILQQRRGRVKFPASPAGTFVHIEKVPIVVGRRPKGTLELLIPPDMIEYIPGDGVEVTRSIDGQDIHYAHLAPGQKINLRVPDGKWHSVTNMTPQHSGV